MVVNALTIDVEDYFQVSAFDDIVARDDWGRYELRVEANTSRLLDLLGEAGVKATFFVLGWVAERAPSLVRRIVDEGHEVASHGYGHRLIYNQTHAEFRDDVRRAKLVIESACGRAVLGYRAPSYSIISSTLWALDILIEEGYLYDASIFPIHHDYYGIPDAPRHAGYLEQNSGRIFEVPASTVRLASVNLPIGGGGYFRMLPYQWTAWGIRHLNEVERKPAVFYLHPWEIDPGQPRLPAGRLSRFRHYRNLHRVEPRLRRLLSDFAFGPLESWLPYEGQALSSSAIAGVVQLSS